MKWSFLKFANLIVFLGLIIVSMMHPVALPVLIAYCVLWLLYEVKFAQYLVAEFEDNSTTNGLRLVNIINSIKTILENNWELLQALNQSIPLMETDDPDDEIYTKPERFIPKLGKQYWVIYQFAGGDSEGLFNQVSNDGDNFDTRNIGNGNCFKTKKEARKAYDFIISALRSN